MTAIHDPIVAVSSPPGRSVRGIVRVSGGDLTPTINALFKSAPTPRTLARCRLSEAVHGCAGLPCLVLYHPGPKSFTGQDTLEIQVPGNPAMLERALHGIISVLRRHDDASRIADAGEFAQRAYLAGRIDLTRAEGVAATISAVSDAQLHAARLLRSGRLGGWAATLVDRLAQLLALVEAGIDFVDQDGVVAITPCELDNGLAEIERDLRGMLNRSRSWSSLEALPWVVLAGPPNAGKSTLFNTLLGHERAVTSDLAGTTRDVLAEPLRIEDSDGRAAEVMLVDVAGLDEPSAGLDASMQRAANDALDRADLLVWVRPQGAAAAPPHNDALIVESKCDLQEPAEREPDDVLRLSAHSGEGVAELRRAIGQRVGDRAVTLAGELLALNPRHHDEMNATLADVVEARTMVADQLADDTLAEMEVVADRLRAALDHLGAIGGEMTPDDVIGKVFATFCVGK